MGPARTALAAALLEDVSLEMTGKDVDQLSAARGGIPPGTRVDVTHLATEDLPTRLAAVRAVGECGFRPVPHVAARRLRSEAELEAVLAGLRGVDGADHVFVVGGDPPSPEGPYDDALSVLSSGLLQRTGVRAVSLTGYPEGHPHISDTALWDALQRKAATLRAQGLTGDVVTQFGFDADAVLGWLEQLRERGVDLPVRVGVPGPAGVRRLLTYAARFGIGTSAGIARKYGLSLTNLLGSAGPGRFVKALADGYDSNRHGTVKLHLYTFGGLAATADWVAEARGGGLA